MKWLVRVAASVAAAVCLGAQGREAFSGSFKHPAIAYDTSPLDDAATRLDQQIGNGSKRLQFDKVRGYLPSILQALSIPVESQVAVFSQTSLQAPLISAHQPRAVYFNDHVAVGWVPGADELEIAAQDPTQGVVFYRLEQKETAAPRLERSRACLRCHVAWETLAVPGFMVLSTGPDDPNGYATGGAVDHRDDISSRWGKWYLTGPSIPKAGLGTAIKAAPWLNTAFDARSYLSPHSDVVALMVLEHQARAMNLITYLGWETRIGASDTRLDTIVNGFVDYFVFADEAPLPGKFEGSSAFAAKFQGEGKRDSRRRSLRELDLNQRLMHYRCSYMIDSAAFDALPARAKQKVAARMSTVLRDRDPAALEILSETKPDLFNAAAAKSR
jgi:hypothetical protein